MKDPAKSHLVLVPCVVDEGAEQALESACLALRAVSEYARATGQSRSAPARALTVDLVTDLMHLSEQSGFSFEAILAEAQAAFASDRGGAVPRPA